MEALIKKAKHCTICASHLPLGPRPVFTVHPKAKVLLVGQAPGTKVHASGVPWDDASGDRLRSWLGISREVFYDPEVFAILPMGFCYPGKGKSGDLPPRPECAPEWHGPFLRLMPEIALTLLIGAYAQSYYLDNKREKTLTKTVRQWKNYFPDFLPLPHPSPRNNIWLRKNPWFEEEVVPALQEKVRKIFGNSQ